MVERLARRVPVLSALPWDAVDAARAEAFFGAPKYGHLAKALFGVVQLVHNLFLMPETSPKEKRVTEPLRLPQDVNPLDAFKVFTRGKTVGFLSRFASTRAPTGVSTVR